MGPLMSRLKNLVELWVQYILWLPQCFPSSGNPFHFTKYYTPTMNEWVLSLIITMDIFAAIIAVATIDVCCFGWFRETSRWMKRTHGIWISLEKSGDPRVQVRIFG